MTHWQATLDAVYKEHAARILAALVRVFGTRNLELAEDVLQESFRKALVAWQRNGVPEEPAAWLFTAAKRRAIDVVRAQRTERKFSADLAQHLESGWTMTHAVEQEFEQERIQDHQLRMIFMCTNAELSAENRLVLILRTLCGFSIPAIARALLLSEATVKKRLVRTRERLQGHAFEFPPPERLGQVMDSVHTVLYLLFNEGFHSTDGTRLMNLELCREAIHLASLLTAEPRVVNRDTLGLLALMQFHLARAATRVDAGGNNVPIDLQDRAAWDRISIEDTRRALATAAVDPSDATERFLIEAKIAEQHCIAASFEHTNWQAILAWYDALVRVTSSPLAELNRAVALGHSGHVAAALGAVDAADKHAALRGSHLPDAVRAHLHALGGDAERAQAYAAQSMQLGGTPHEQRLLREQIERLLARRRPG